MRRSLIAVFASVIAIFGCEGPPLPELDPVPDATLQSSRGDEVSLEDLEGKVVIYDFIFTRCAASCPMMTAKMGELAMALGSDEVRFVSISVDPEWDTPEVMSQYRDAVTTDDRWVFLTGTREQVREISVDGFKLAAEPPGESVESGPIVHSTKFILSDRSGTIRGYYDSISREALKQLEMDSKRLLRN